MQYQYQFSLSPRAIDILGNLVRPTQEQIKKKRTKDTVYGVGNSLEEIQERLGLSVHQLRKVLQKELYGFVGVFFGNFLGHHSHKFYSENIMNDRQAHSLMERIHKRGNEVMFTRKGTIVEAIPKKNSRHYGLYVPEQVRDNIERAIDDENHIFYGEIEEASLPVLEFMFRRTRELRNRHGDNWYPYFSDNSISKKTNIPLEKVAQSNLDLTGLICESYQMVVMRPWRKRLFLPSSRFAIVKGLLD